MKPNSLDSQNSQTEASGASESFTAAEIAAYLGVEVEQFHVLAGNGDLKAFEIEGEYFYKSADVRHFLINAGVLEGESVW